MLAIHITRSEVVWTTFSTSQAAASEVAHLNGCKTFAAVALLHANMNVVLVRALLRFGIGEWVWRKTQQEVEYGNTEYFVDLYENTPDSMATGSEAGFAV